ncbi:hypothetical protein [Rhodopirellula sallentina]|uniref:Signal peptide protein n=1 Tax=Rhodopirellula sallentina SM41 TaxID=1263870 RepID=M5UAK9_9BACT|nr:hypothetical protein [Rhodopirellula sallentina]EMI58460.1 signal peptide protein [Rhodopirellula sallentina SM41]
MKPNEVVTNHAPTTRGFIQWVVGLFAGTLVIWGTSPLFVRSYHERVFDSATQRWVYPASTDYRWRSEGYATTRIGPHGMPGRTRLPPTNTKRVIALWGDSQAEGVCVGDHEKLWAQLENAFSPNASASLAVLPMAHSGDDAIDWTSRFRLAERRLGVTEHVVLVCEIEDLECLASEEVDQPASDDGGRNIAGLDLIPDFVIHAVRGLVFDADTSQLRRLRFMPGRVCGVVSSGNAEPNATTVRADESFSAADIARQMRDATAQPVTLVYAPLVPVVMGDEVIRDDERSADFETISAALAAHDIAVVDCREDLVAASDSGRFPHGFHNGKIGSGHLNATGYRTIANAIARSSD